MAEIEKVDTWQGRLPPITQASETRGSSLSKLERLTR